MSLNTTLYIKNINEKIKIPDLKYCLYYLFNKYGRVIDIVINKSNKMRGQAFIVYNSLESCENAMLDLQHQKIFNKEIHIEYAKTMSNKVLILQNKLKINPKYLKYKEKIKSIIEKNKTSESIPLAATNNNNYYQFEVLKDNEIITESMLNILLKKFKSYDKLIDNCDNYIVQFTDLNDYKLAYNILSKIKLENDIQITIKKIN